MLKNSTFIARSSGKSSRLVAGTPTRLLSSLSFQISAAFLLLLLLFGAASLYSVGAFQRQIDYSSLIDTAGKLELTAQYLHMQAMNYEQNAPRDYPTYFRDVRLYYQDLMSHVEVFDRVVDEFMHEDFRGKMDRFLPWPRPNVSNSVTKAIRNMEQTWLDYRAGLIAALGPDQEEPRLKFAAEHNLENHAQLERAAKTLTESLRLWAAAEHRKVIRVSLLLIAAAGSLVTLPILAILYPKTLAPLRRTITGIRRVADGDFGHVIPVGGTSEVRQLTESFNGLSGRLDVLFTLIERLQRGNDLDEIIRFLSQEFPALLRIDWIGVVLFGTEGATAHVEVSYLDGQPERVSRQPFRLRGTLLEKALDGGTPFHITNMVETAAASPNYQFLRSLVERGLQDAIILPLTPQTLTPIPAVVVFATRKRGRYDSAHLQFLDNIAQLITHSFGRTVRLAEHGRLAAIGEFASAIAHELRTPLATLTLAIDYFAHLSLEEKAAKRIELARQESARMQRLLEEILLYAKPVNLTQDACDAVPTDAQITWTVGDDPGLGSVTLEVKNPGEPISPELLTRLTEPFFTTKPSGTGLGLAIVRRLTLIHGGELSFSSAHTGTTCARIVLPRLVSKASGSDDTFPPRDADL